MTNDLRKRFNQHNSNKSTFTKIVVHINLCIMKLHIIKQMLGRENYILNLGWVNVISKID